MTRTVLLFHVLAAITGLGMFAPDILLTRIYREAQSIGEKIRLARLHTLLSMTAQWSLLVLAVTGGILTYRGGYSWYNFSTVPWLAIKQTLILAMLVLLVMGWSKVRALHRALATERAAQMLELYEKNRFRGHISYGLALVMAILGVLKPF